MLLFLQMGVLGASVSRAQCLCSDQRVAAADLRLVDSAVKLSCHVFLRGRVVASQLHAVCLSAEGQRCRLQHSRSSTADTSTRRSDSGRRVRPISDPRIWFTPSSSREWSQTLLQFRRSDFPEIIESVSCSFCAAEMMLMQWSPSTVCQVRPGENDRHTQTRWC